MQTIRWIVVLAGTLFIGAGPAMASAMAAGNGEIRGRVVDAEDGTPLIGTTVTLVGRFTGAIADMAGEYRISRLPVGEYILEFSHVGYETDRLERVQVTEGQSIEANASLVERLTTLKGITVTPGRFQIMGAEPTASQSLTQSEMETVPQLGDDFFRAVKRLPGMSGNDFSTRFTVRGGEYDEVLVTLDGLEIYEPFHLKDIDGGAISVVDVAAVDGIDLMTGGFPSPYGDRMSGVFDIKSRRIPPDHRRLSVGLSMMNLRFLSEGTFGENRGAWLVSARRGYIDLVLQLAGADNEMKPTYYDLFAKTRYRLGDKHILSANVLHAADDLRLIGEDEDIGDTVQTSYGNSYGWLTLWSELHPHLTVRNLVSVGKVKHDRFGHDFYSGPEVVGKVAWDYESFTFAGFKSDWEYEAADWYFVRSGFDGRWIEADYDYVNNLYNYEYRQAPDGSYYIELSHIDTTQAVLSPSGNKLGLYLSNRFRPWRNLTFELGGRYDRASYTGDELWSPRVNLSYDVGPRTTLRAGWGHFYQMERIDEIMVGDGETGFHPAEKAQHWVAGIQHDFDNGVHFRLEGYLKEYTDLRPDYRNSFDDVELFPETEYDRTIVYRESSSSRGLELYLKKDTGGRWAWWASYAWAHAEDEVSDIEFPPENVTIAYDKTLPTPNDQRHTLYFDLNYRPNHNWQINLALQFHTGWPYTGVHLAYYTSGDDRYYYIQSDEQWSSRHDAYRRVDLRINRYFSVGTGRITAFVELLNIFDNENVRGYDYHIVSGRNGYNLNADPEHWFGRMPSFGVTYEVGL